METDGELIQNIANLGSAIIILMCSFIKVPQILYIRERKSAQGIYLQAMMMEATGFTVITLYNYTNQYGILTYLEYPIILLQVYVMFYYVLSFKRILYEPIVSVVAGVYVCAIIAFMMAWLPKSILAFLVPFCTPLSGFAKVTYIYGIIKTANADAVSLTTWLISIVTNFARIVTVYLDSGDWRLMANFSISTVLSLGVLVTAIYYQRQSLNRQPRRKSAVRQQTHQD